MSKPTVHLEPLRDVPQGAIAAFSVIFSGLRDRQLVALKFRERDVTRTERGGNTTLGTVKVKAHHYSPQRQAYQNPFFHFSIDEKLWARRWRGETEKIVFSMPSGPPPAYAPQFGIFAPQHQFELEIPQRARTNEGETWEIQVCAKIAGKEVVSKIYPVARLSRQVPRNKATYRWYDGHQVQFFADASDDHPSTGGAFRELLTAIDQAKNFIFLADWSFHPYARINRAAPGLEGTIGHILSTKARDNPNMLIAIHTWDHVNAAMKDAQNDDGDDYLDVIAGGTRPANLLWRRSSRTGVGNSHHQKYVVLDCPGPGGKEDIKAFFGGLDLTQGRYDWGEHLIGPASEINDRRIDDFMTTAGDYNDWYNGEFSGDTNLPRQPWHDIHGWIQGPAAWDVIKEFVGRWLKNVAYDFKPGGDTSAAAINSVRDKFRELLDRQRHRNLIQQYENPRRTARFPWAAQVYRSALKEEWAQDPPLDINGRWYFDWPYGLGTSERSIQDAYLQAIDQADKYIYIETQYLISSGQYWNGPLSSVANQIAHRIVERVKYHKSNGNRFHVYVIIPMFPEGVPDSAAPKAQRLIEWKTMDYMARGIGDDWQNYLSFFFLAKTNHQGRDIVTQGSRAQRVRANGRYMIYVHSKLMIVDDRYIIFGSANLNERSLAGDRDSEICIGMWPSHYAVEDRCVNQLRDFRIKLFQEHMGHGFAAERNPESRHCSQTMQREARENYLKLRRGQQVTGHLMMLPFEMRVEEERMERIQQGRHHTFTEVVDGDLAGDHSLPRLRVTRQDPSLPDGDDYLPDAPVRNPNAIMQRPSINDSRLAWTWWCTGQWAPLIPWSIVE